MACEKIFTTCKCFFSVGVIFCYFTTNVLSIKNERPSPDPSSMRVKRASVRVAVVLTDFHKQLVVDEHNRFRSSVTPPASDMLRMVWYDELGKTAETHSRLCLFNHSQGLSTANFSEVGESIYIDGNVRTVSEVLKVAMKSWEDEVRYYSLQDNFCRQDCSHYTQLVWANTYAVGCGVTTCNNPNAYTGSIWPEGQFVVCHYGPAGNYFDVKPYVQGTPCSKCTSRFPICSNHLCSSTRSYHQCFAHALIFGLFFTLAGLNL